MDDDEGYSVRDCQDQLARWQQQLDYALARESAKRKAQSAKREERTPAWLAALKSDEGFQAWKRRKERESER